MKKFILALLFASHLFALDWLIDYNEALELSKNSNKPVLVIFLRQDCKYCAKLVSETLSNDVIAKTIEANYVPLYIDVNTNQTEAVKTGLNFNGVPASFVLNSSGKQKSKLFGYHPPMGYMGFLQQNAK